MSKALLLQVAALAMAVGLATGVAAQDIPPDALHCGLRAPPDAAATGVRPPRRLPIRMFPVNPGDNYTGCQWFWIAMARPDVWDYSSVTFYENGAPRVQRITYPPLPVQITIQKCVMGHDGQARKVVEAGNDWQLDCPGARQLREWLRVIPKENELWEFF
jgi:hypothetical protein